MDRIMFTDIINNGAVYHNDPHRLHFQQTFLQNLAFWQNYNRKFSLLFDFFNHNLEYATALMVAAYTPSPISSAYSNISTPSPFISKNIYAPNISTSSTETTILSSDKSTNCGQCDKVLRNKKEARHHKVLVHDRTHECEICVKTFLSDVLLKTHAAKKHPSKKDKACLAQSPANKKQYQCQICERSYETYYNYKEHLAKHGGKTFQCTICNKFLSGQSALSRHSKIHTKPHSCVLCFERFSSNYDLECHWSYYHSDKKKFNCKHCQRYLYNYSGLLRHERLCSFATAKDQPAIEQKENLDKK
uniref:C2H2-type domain-containing protein n=1 Tax=Rhabditophanes sp. KR3021 TaxID=114890 RepID=A0AC35U1G6_9BILA